MDFEYIFQKICARRAVDYKKSESVAFNMRITFGLASLTELLPAVANTFYYIRNIRWTNPNGTTGTPWLRVTDYGGGSGGTIDYPVTGTAVTAGSDMGMVETNSLLYVVNNFTAGAFCVMGTVFKITYS